MAPLRPLATTMILTLVLLPGLGSRSWKEFGLEQSESVKIFIFKSDSDLIFYSPIVTSVATLL